MNKIISNSIILSIVGLIFFAVNLYGENIITFDEEIYSNRDFDKRLEGINKELRELKGEIISSLMASDKSLIDRKGSYLTFYLSLNTSKRLDIEEIKIKIKGRTSFVYKYSDDEVNVLNKGLIHRFVLNERPSGNDYITAEYRLKGGVLQSEELLVNSNAVAVQLNIIEKMWPLKPSIEYRLIY